MKMLFTTQSEAQAAEYPNLTTTTARVHDSARKRGWFAPPIPFLPVLLFAILSSTAAAKAVRTLLKDSHQSRAGS
jgi:hypothetical protein